MKLLLFLFYYVLAFTAHQARMAKKVLLKRSCVPQFARVIDSVLKDEIAFTSTDGLSVFVDGSRLEYAPNTFHNVLVHESSHLCGSTHGDGTLAMSYAVQTWPNGTVKDDGRRVAIP